MTAIVDIPREVRGLIIDRCCWRCECCGEPIMCRLFDVILRNQERPAGAENAVAVLASHGDRIVSGSDPADRQKGLFLWPRQDPAATPVQRFGDPVREWLLPDGGVTRRDPAGGAA